jgi:ElaB/YqjD/DUF883 family membrane-anchored ribosome-binding protein
MMNATTDNGDWARSGAPNPSTTDLEREGEEIRADLDRTLDEIERKLSPGELLDRSMEFFRNNGSEFIREAGETVRNNPIPVLLTAAGLIWLTTAVASKASRSSSTSSPDEGEEFSSLRGSSGGEYGESDYAAGSENYGQENYAQQDTQSRVRSTTQRVKGKLSNSMHALQERTGKAGANINNLVQQQPIALGALALAAGALIGAALPITQYENRLIGPVHDRTLARAKQAGEKQYENLRQAVSSATEQGNGSNGSNASSAQRSQDQPEQG